MPSVFPDVRHELERTLVSARAYAKETRSYREPEYRNPEWDVERRLAGAILVQAIRDYHEGKKAAQKHKITSLSYCGDNLVRSKIRDGLAAYSWFKNEPMPGKTGWTFDHVCEVLRLDRETVASAARLPSAYRSLEHTMKVMP
jgi:hypothetical protein